MGAPLPWFPFFIDKWDTDATVRQMSMAERGVYVSLLCWQWREGYVPPDAKGVAKALGCSRKLVASVLTKSFIKMDTEGDFLVNNTLLEIYMGQQQKSDKAAHAGRISAARRAHTPLGRSRSQIQKEIQKSLSSSDDKKNGNNQVKGASWQPGETV